MPLFRAAAIVAIILTLGNAAQVAFNNEGDVNANMATIEQTVEGTTVALAKDSTVVDSMKQSNLQAAPIEMVAPTTNWIFFYAFYYNNNNHL